MDVRRLLRAVSVASALAVATACAEATQADSGVGATGGAAVLADLDITYDPGDATARATFTLQCAEDGTAVAGDHPAPEAACEGVATSDDPFAEVPDDAMCAQVFGGPDTASVAGTHRGEPVDTSFSLRNGCEIQRWQDAAVLTGIGPDDLPAR